MVNPPHRVAHRGGSHLAPENTLAAFRNALTMPVDAIELDVQMSRDGYAIVFHDATVERLTDGVGNILDLDFAYLRSLNAAAHFSGGWPQSEQIPMLREVLELAKGRIQVYIEIKLGKRDGTYVRYPDIVETVVREVQAARMLDQVVIISFDWQQLAEAKALEPALQTGAIVSKDVWSPHAEHALDTLCNQVIGYGCQWVNLDYQLFMADLPALLHRRGLQVGLWTINTLDELRRLAASGVDSLTSDRPDIFAQM